MRFDEETAAVVSLLLFNIITVTVIILGWILLRRYRGDKQNVHRHMSVVSEADFDDFQVYSVKE